MHNPVYISFRYLLERLFAFLLHDGVCCASRQPLTQWKSHSAHVKHPTLYQLWIIFILCLAGRLLSPTTTTTTMLVKYFQFPVCSTFSLFLSLLFYFAAAPLPFPLINNAIELCGINSGAFAWSTESSAHTLRLFVIFWPWTLLTLPALKQRVNEAYGIA